MGTDAATARRQSPLRGSLETKQNSTLPWAPTKELLMRTGTTNALWAFIGGEGVSGREALKGVWCVHICELCSRNTLCSFTHVLLPAVTSQWVQLLCCVAIILEAPLTSLCFHWVFWEGFDCLRGVNHQPFHYPLGWMFLFFLFLHQTGGKGHQKHCILFAPIMR